jgi:hypothetical protein
LVFLGVALPAFAETITLVPLYDAVGTNPDGSKYEGMASVKVLSDTTFTIERSINGSTYAGYGRRMNDTLTVTTMVDGEPGVIVYKVDGKGLRGWWTVRGRSGNGTEVLLPR